ncbi:MAG: Na+/H+ antiporter NhaC family protein [Ruminococcus sp.]|nr:Na+/H+ antiporter NhaC family protein [Ruminococcus sp.]
MVGTFWALVPPIIAILLALITKEVYSSLFVGILMGGLFYADFSPVKAMNHIVDDGFTASLSSAGNVGILIFLVILGTIVALMNKAGGSAAFGEWAQKRIKTRIGAQLATIALGVLIFIDDYFNCLTVGSVMQPITKRHNISRQKLAYLIDATAAPVCIIAPISSWAAAVTGFVEDEDGFSLFINAIPYNYYALLTIVFMIGIVLLKTDFGPMAKYEKLAEQSEELAESEKKKQSKGRVIDLLFPIITLICGCVLGMIYTGGFFDGVSFIDAFADCDASKGLVIGSSSALILTVLFYLVRRILPFKACMECLPEGFKAMVPAILILTFAWTLKNMTDSLGAAQYVHDLLEGSASGLDSFLPAIIFVIAAFLSFATGTSWGTFGILIPIVVNVFSGSDHTMMVISISACMAGSVCGDHCSPISDTTIMASAGAKCVHVEHVSSQLPYAVIVALISFISYVIAGFVKNAVICLAIGIALTVFALMLVKYVLSGKQQDAPAKEAE